MIKCHWSPNLSVVEKATNHHMLYDKRIPAEERLSTFEGPIQWAKLESVASNTLLEDVNASVKQIEQHLELHNSAKLLGGEFYFKVDRADNLVLLFALNIKTDKNMFREPKDTQLALHPHHNPN